MQRPIEPIIGKLRGMTPKKPTSASPSTRLIWPFFRERAVFICLGLLALMIVDLLQLFIPRIIKRTVDGLTSATTNAHELLQYALAIAILALFIALFRYFWRRLLLGTSRHIEEGLRNRLFAHIQTLSAAYFDRTTVGELMAHATNDIKQIRMACGMGMVALNDSLVLGTAAAAFMVYISPRLTAFVLIPMPFIVFGTRFFSRKMHHGYQEVQRNFADLTEIVRERFAGIRIIKAYTQEQAAVRQVEKSSKDYVAANLKLVKVVGAFLPMMVLLTNLSLAIVLYLGGRMTISGTITPGDFVAFIAYLGLLAWPMMAMGWVTNLIQRGRASLDRIDIIFQTRPQVISSPAARPLKSVESEILFENVSFTYGDRRGQTRTAAVLRHLSVGLKIGHTLGIVGPPGSGKTTLLNLIPRIYDVGEGRVCVDGHDIRDIRLPDLRRVIAFVPQEPFLFATSIRENITLGNPQIDTTQVIVAARQAAIYDTIAAFPDGLDTLVGEKGIVLSGGQKQRIALARALLQDRPLLVLDDPISQVDVQTGQRIIDHIRSLAGSRTVIIVSHRLSALQHADHIFSLDHGRIIESGTHDELMQAGGYYARTFELQQIEGT